MAWRGESWAEIVARTAGASPRRPPPIVERESAASLAARAERLTFDVARIAIGPDGLSLGAGMEAIETSFLHLYHVEPVDPWPSIALGWVDRGAPYATVLTPREEETLAFAERVGELMDTCARRAAHALARGWLDAPEVGWEPVESLPDEGEVAEMGGYRAAPQASDPILAMRTIAPAAPRLLTWRWAQKTERRIEPRKIVLTQSYVYVRTRDERIVRIATALLRTARRTPAGERIYVFGRHTELLVVHAEGCELTAALDARVGIEP